jgi:hypothetical protein
MERTGIATDRVWGVLFSILKAEEGALDTAEGSTRATARTARSV